MHYLCGMANGFTKREITGAVLFMAVALLIVLLVALGERRPRPVVEPFEPKEQALKPAPMDSIPSPRRAFDPNTATYEELLAVGMSRAEAVSLLKFRSAGKVFRIREPFVTASATRHTKPSSHILI